MNPFIQSFYTRMSTHIQVFYTSFYVENSLLFGLNIFIKFLSKMSRGQIWFSHFPIFKFCSGTEVFALLYCIFFINVKYLFKLLEFKSQLMN